MSGTIDARLAELGIELPEPSVAVGNYLPFVVSGNMVYISGQLPIGPEGLRYAGKVEIDISLDAARDAARMCGLNLIAQLKNACGGDLDRLTRVVKLGGFINCGPDYEAHPAVLNATSDLMVEVFGDAGRHARSAVGCVSLPLNTPVEIDGIFEID